VVRALAAGADVREPALIFASTIDHEPALLFGLDVALGDDGTSYVVGGGGASVGTIAIDGAGAACVAELSPYQTIDVELVQAR
jgi:hypothetical protein